MTTKQTLRNMLALSGGYVGALVGLVCGATYLAFVAVVAGGVLLGYFLPLD